MIEERRDLPESVAGLTSTALRAYSRRIGCYAGVAILGLIFEGIANAIRPHDTGILEAGSIVVDAAISAVVAIGVVGDVRSGQPASTGSILSRALDRWGLVTAVTMLITLVTVATSAGVFGSPEENIYGLLAIPIVVVWGTLVFATVIAAVDTTTPAPLLVIGSLGRSISLSLSIPNFGRLLILSAVALVPALAQMALAGWLQSRHVGAWEFFGNIPIDALATGPLQAVFTVFFLDFERRMSRRPGS